MATLPESERLEVYKKFITELNLNRTSMNLTKTQLKAAVAAIDQWVDDNAISFNQAIPQPARGVLTLEQKIGLLTYVAAKRRGGA